MKRLMGLAAVAALLGLAACADGPTVPAQPCHWTIAITIVLPDTLGEAGTTDEIQPKKKLVCPGA
jgi:ABC-type glycerol-3-phosphate transport system substrate-binding protein